jgi:hypothetical protein
MGVPAKLPRPVMSGMIGMPRVGGFRADGARHRARHPRDVFRHPGGLTIASHFSAIFNRWSTTCYPPVMRRINRWWHTSCYRVPACSCYPPAVSAFRPRGQQTGRYIPVGTNANRGHDRFFLRAPKYGKKQEQLKAMGR